MVQVVIIEDEESISAFLKKMVLGLRPEWFVAAELRSVEESVEWFGSNSAPDLILMDIQLSDGVCFSIFDKVKVRGSIIFTTAYDQYAIKAFEVNSIGYLLKPIKEERLRKAIEKFELLNDVQKNESVDYTNLFQLIRNGMPAYRDKLLVQQAASYYSIFTQQVAYFYIENRIVYAVTADQKEHVVDYTLDSLESELNPNDFFRANRSFIVNGNYILKFENYFGGKLIIRLKPPLKNTISVSRLKATEFKVWMGK